MNISDSALLIVAVMNFTLCALILWNNWRNSSAIWFSLFAISLGIWALTIMGFRSVSHLGLSVFFLKLSYSVASCIAATFFVFVHEFPKPYPSKNIWKNLLIFNTLVVTILPFLPNLLIVGIENVPGNRMGIQEPVGYTVFSLYFILYFFGALYILLKRWRSTSGDIKKHIGFIIWSVLIAGLIGTFFNLILPSPFLQEWHFTWLGPIFTAIIVIVVAYAIAKHKLLNVEILSATLLVLTITLVFLVQIIFVESEQEFIVRLTFFIVTVIAGWFLVRSIRQEVRTREQLERLAMQLQGANKELERLNQAKSDFLSIASHQLKTPLSIIKGYVSMSLEGSFGQIADEVKEQLKKVYLSNERLISLVDDLLNLSRIEEGRMQYDWTEENMTSIINSVVDELAETADRKGLTVVWSPPDKQLFCKVDRNKIRNVIFNLFDNAIKYTDKGSIEITLSSQKQEVLISVKDTGRGITSGALDKLFNKFVRAESTEGKKNTAVYGFGLGLYIAKLIVRDHKGKVWAESAGEGKGSTFYICLPLLKEVAKNAAPKILVSSTKKSLAVLASALGTKLGKAKTKRTTKQ